MVLKPEHAIYRLTDQKFELGDRVRMVKRSGAVPFAEMGVVVGIELNSIDVLWDDEIYPGTTLDDRCVLTSIHRYCE
jgi:5'-3' exoribonuclease 1